MATKHQTSILVPKTKSYAERTKRICKIAEVEFYKKRKNSYADIKCLNHYLIHSAR